MSQEALEIVREAIAAINLADVERFSALTHPDFELHVAPELSAEPDTYRGRAGIQRYFESFSEAFEAMRFEAERFVDAGSSVVVAIRMTATGKLTKIPVEQRNAGIWSVTDGMIIGVQTYGSLSDALEAAGLEE